MSTNSLSVEHIKKKHHLLDEIDEKDNANETKRVKLDDIDKEVENPSGSQG